MLVHWSPNLSVGVKALDDDHEALIETLNRLDAMIEDGQLDQVEGLLVSLVDQTQAHFQHEEAIMARTGYPELEHHRSLHQALLHEIHEFLNEFDDGKAIGPETTAFVKNWLLNHILESDKALGGYLQGRGVA